MSAIVIKQAEPGSQFVCEDGTVTRTMFHGIRVLFTVREDDLVADIEANVIKHFGRGERGQFMFRRVMCAAYPGRVYFSAEE